jgi:hypothetical protein
LPGSKDNARRPTGPPTRHGEKHSKPHACAATAEKKRTVNTFAALLEKCSALMANDAAQWKPKRKTPLPRTKIGTGNALHQALKAKRTKEQNANEKPEMPD